MKHLILACSVMALTATAATAANVGVSVNIGEPGFFGQLDIGDYPQPALVYPKPVIIEREPAGAHLEPLYLHVPPGQERHWKRYCGRYSACGRPVYFVQDRWYKQVYVPRYHERHDHRDEDHRHDHDDHHDRDDRHDHDRHDDH